MGSGVTLHVHLRWVPEVGVRDSTVMRHCYSWSFLEFKRLERYRWLWEQRKVGAGSYH